MKSKRPDFVPPDAMQLATRPELRAPRDVPGIAPPPAVSQDQLDISFRLHLIATAVPPSYPVSIIARDLLSLINGFVAESRRADQAEARLRALHEHERPAAARN